MLKLEVGDLVELTPALLNRPLDTPVGSRGIVTKFWLGGRDGFINILWLTRKIPKQHDGAYFAIRFKKICSAEALASADPKLLKGKIPKYIDTVLAEIPEPSLIELDGECIRPCKFSLGIGKIVFRYLKK